MTCQANLRQWGILWATYTAENDGRLPGWYDRRQDTTDPVWWGWGWEWGWRGPDASPEARERYDMIKDIVCCPLATKPVNQAFAARDRRPGGTFVAWSWAGRPQPSYDGCGSYGANSWTIGWWWDWPDDQRPFRVTLAAKNAAAVPVYLDSCWPSIGHWWGDEKVPAPPFDAVPTRADGPGPGNSCINRHDGCVNGLFPDWSVRSPYSLGLGVSVRSSQRPVSGLVGAQGRSQGALDPQVASRI